ncbi:gamma-type small acid-soluble spore protein [Lysinibacillus sp. 54212]|uniref:gamma-type small acid-soluble spore protein n=1 Tax=Lysinibacillus sp. 54212 TaxID=3119829 RepID=UPI002FCB6F01
MKKNNQNNQNTNAEFGYETDVNQVKQQIQQAEAKKQQASGSFNKNGKQKMPSSMNAEFGYETDVNQVKQQIQQAEAKKQQASGSYANNSNQNGTK